MVVLEMSVKDLLAEMLKNYNEKLAHDLNYISAFEKKELKIIDTFCYNLDNQAKKNCTDSSSNEQLPSTLPATDSRTNLQLCNELKAAKVTKVSESPLLQANNIKSSLQEFMECSNTLINVGKVLREVPQQPDNQSCIALNSLNLIDANRLETKIQILKYADNATSMKLSYDLINVLKETEGLMCERYELTEKFIEVFSSKNEVVAVKFSNVFRKNCTLCVKRYADSCTTFKIKVLVDIIEIKDASSISENIQIRSSQITQENLNILSSRTSFDSDIIYNVDENSANPVIHISNLSIPLKYSNLNFDRPFESHITKNSLETVKMPLVSNVQDIYADDCIIVNDFDDKMDGSSDGIFDSESENSVEHFIKHEPRLLNSIVKLEDVGMCQWTEKSLKSSSEKQFNKRANTPCDNPASKLDASARFLRLVKRRAIQNLNRTTKREVCKRKYNTRSSNRENRVRFKVENDTV